MCPRRLLLTLCHLLLISMSLGASSAFGQTPTVAIGGELQVNTYTSRDQAVPDAAILEGGTFVIVWQTAGDDIDTSVSAIRARLYSSSGEPVGESFLVNDYTTGSQETPAVAAGSDGGFVVVWDSVGSVGDDEVGFSVQGQRFDSGGGPVGAQFQVNTYTTGAQTGARVAVGPDGDFVVVWTSDGSDGADTDSGSVRARRFGSDGSALGAPFEVNAYTTGHQDEVSVAVGDDGGFVVVWASSQSDDGDEVGGSIQAQRFDSAGDPEGGQFRVNAYTTSVQNSPDIDMAPDGSFVVTWSSFGSNNGDRDTRNVQARRFSSLGDPLGDDFLVHTYTTATQDDPSVAVDGSGDFVIAWWSFGSDNGDPSLRGVQARRFLSSGAPLGGQFLVNSYVPFDQDAAAVAVDSAGDFVVAWQSAVASDGSLLNVKAQKFRVTSDLGDLYFFDVDGDGRQSISDEGADGLTVRLRSGLGELLDTTTTDSEGAFLFTPKIALGGVADEFFLEFVRPGPFAFTAENVGDDEEIDSDANSQGQTATITVSSAGESFRNLDAGLVSSVPALGDRVWADANFDGIQQVDEIGVPGVTLRLLDDSGNVLETAITDADGTYQFTGLGTDLFRIEIDPPTGSLLSPQFAGDSGLLDSDFDPSTLRTELFSYDSKTIRREFDAGLLLPGDLQTPTVSAGGPFQANSYGTGDQLDPEIAADGSGNFLILWQSREGTVDTDDLSVQARRFDSGGSPLGAQFLVNSYTTNAQDRLAVGMNASGEFVVAWDSYGSVNGDDSYYSVQAQRYDSGGNRLAAEFQVNTYTTYSQSDPSVAMGEDGAFVIVWQSEGSFGDDDSGNSIQGQRFASNGVPVASQFQINTSTSSDQRSPKVALQANGGFVVVWNDAGTAFNSIRGQRFDSGGSALSGELQLTPGTAADVFDVEMEADPTTGHFAVAWQIDDDGDNDGIRARRFDSSGQPLGDVMAVNSYTTGQQREPSLTMDPDGDFIIVWQSFGDEVDDDRYSIQGRRYGSDGRDIGEEFRVNSYTTEAQIWPAVAADGFGDFVVTWVDYRDDLGDASDRGINAQRFRVTADLGDRVFFDEASDGLQSPGDLGVEGVGVRLRSGSGDLLAETTTDADGLYSFKPKIASKGIIDQFVLEFDAPLTGLFARQGVGSDDAVDSDVDPATGQTEALIVFSAGEKFLDLDAGYRPPPLFEDGFESGDTSAWSATSP